MATSGLVDAVERAILDYSREAGLEDDEVKTAMSDFLADFRHLCDRWGLDFAELDRMAYNHYTEEIGNGRDE